jgi:hypothetical protein
VNDAILNEIIIGRAEPQIYAFSTNDIPAAWKIGDTNRDVKKRLEEWGKFFTDINLEYSESASLNDGEALFRDFAVHQYLEEKGHTRLCENDFQDGLYYSREFFKSVSTNVIVEAINAIKTDYNQKGNKYTYYKAGDKIEKTYDRNQDYSLRDIQKETVDKFHSAVKKGHTNLLMYAVMRFGKSFTALHCALKIDAKIILVLSAKADVKEEWKGTVQSHKDFEDYKFADESNLKRILSNRDNSTRIIIFLTLQDLQGTKIKEKHKELFADDFKIDLIIVDETHFGARASSYGRILLDKNGREIYINDDFQEDKIKQGVPQSDEEIKKFFDPKYMLHLSGTPYRILMGEEFQENEIIANFQYNDIIQARNDWFEDENNQNAEEWENPYFGFPEMIRFAFNPSASAKNKLEELRKENTSYGLSELFRTASLKKDDEKKYRKFIYEDEILSILTAIDGEKEDENILGFLKNQKIIDSKLFRHIVCVLPFKSSCDALASLIKEKQSLLSRFNEYCLINISGLDSNYNNVNDVKNKIRKCEENDQKTITLTVNRMLTGTTVPEWDTMLFFKSTTSSQEYDQSIYRIQNAYIKDYNGVKVNLKPQTILVDFDPNRLFQMQIQKTLIHSLLKQPSQIIPLVDQIREDLKYSPIIHLNLNSLVKVDADSIVDFAREYSKDRSIAEEAFDVPFDSKLMNKKDFKEYISNLNPIDDREGVFIKPFKGDESELDIKKKKNIESVKNVDDKNSFSSGIVDDDEKLRKQLATFRFKILLYSFLSNDVLNSVDDIIKSITIKKGYRSNNLRLWNILGFKDEKMLKIFKEYSSIQILEQFDFKIKNINQFKNDESLEPVVKAETAMKKFGRISDSEIVTPSNVAKELVDMVPWENYVKENYVKENIKILDLSSKQAEVVIAIYKEHGKDMAGKVVSITTSEIAKEITSKIYKILELDTNNILDCFSEQLISDQDDELIDELINEKYDVIISSPPFNIGDSSIYHKFFYLCKKLNPTAFVLLMKANWYSGGGGFMTQLRNDILNDQYIERLNDYPDPKILSSKYGSLRGGVCTILWNKNVKEKGYTLVENYFEDRTVPCKRQLSSSEDCFIRYNEAIGILSKIKCKVKNGYFEVKNRDYFKLPSNSPLLEEKKGSNNKEYYKVYLPKKQVKYVKKIHLQHLETIRKTDINKYKVIVAKASPGTDSIPHLVISDPIISEPGSICTDSHLVVIVYDNSEEGKKKAKQLVKYMKSKFFRFMMFMAKNSHNMTTKTFSFVPKENTSFSDKALFRKYRLEPSEIEFINKVIKSKL